MWPSNRCRRLLLKVLLSEGLPGTGLQILLEGCGLSLVCESVVGDDLPRAVFGRMGRLTGVVGCQSRFHIPGEANVVLVGVGDALEEVDEFHRTPLTVGSRTLRCGRGGVGDGLSLGGSSAVASSGVRRRLWTALAGVADTIKALGGSASALKALNPFGVGVVGLAPHLRKTPTFATLRWAATVDNLRNPPALTACYASSYGG